MYVYVYIDVSNIRPVYGPKDFLEVLINISMPSKNDEVLRYVCFCSLGIMFFFLSSVNMLRKL